MHGRSDRHGAGRVPVALGQTLPGHEAAGEQPQSRHYAALPQLYGRVHLLQLCRTKEKPKRCTRRTYGKAYTSQVRDVVEGEIRLNSIHSKVGEPHLRDRCAWWTHLVR